MKLPRCFQSPLSATAAVVVGLTMIAIPLHHLTQPAAPKRNTGMVAESAALTPCWLSLKLLASAKSVTLSTTDGKELWTAGPTPAGELDTRKPLAVGPEPTDLILKIEFDDPTAETAAFLSIAPDGQEEVTRYAIGTGTIHDLLSFHWDTH